MAGSDFLYVDIVGDRNLTRNLDQMPDIVRAILLEKVASWTNALEERVKDNISTRLTQKSGKLLSAVDSELIEENGKVEGRVFISGVPYAKPQEEGAVTPLHVIYPKNAKVLAFIAATGDKVFATRVLHPGAQIPASHFMKDAYREMGPQISRGIKQAVVEGIRKNMRS